MIQNVKLWLVHNIYPLLLTLIVGVLCGVNYTPHTWLSGWDTLHPEFNFPLAFERMLSGVWRADQGLGATAIHSHMADWPHMLMLYLTSFVLPATLLRYAYFFLMLFLGPLGMYALVSHITKFSHREKVTGFIAGITYLMNVMTVQQFIVPFEMFAAQYGFLPWIFLSTLLILEHHSKKSYLLFSFLIILASPMAYAATLWYAFFLAFALFLGTYVLLHKAHWRTLIKRVVAILTVTVVLNIYWIGPNIYAAVNHGLEVRDSKVNTLFTPEAFAKNQHFGTIQNAALLKNFLFDWEIYRFDTNPPHFEQILIPWQKHLANPWISTVGYLVFILSLVGIILAFSKKRWTLVAFLPVYGLSLLMLLNGTWPMTALFTKLGDLSPIAQEALRFPFTKFSILFMMTLSVYAAYGILYMLYLVRTSHMLQRVVVASYAGLLILYFWPAFTGNLIHQSVRITIPNEYTQMFKWFNTQDHDARVAILPIHSFWNWVYYDWGYQGAGFLQFGIPQPILDRDYDRWSQYNEQYQREMTYAIYSNQPELLGKVIQKYNIRYILFDESIMNVGGRDEATFKWAIPTLLERTGITVKAQQFGPHITIYKTTLPSGAVQTYTTLPDVSPTMIGASEDVAYRKTDGYMTTNLNSKFTDSFRAGFTRDERFTLPIQNAVPVASFSGRMNILGPLDVCGTNTTITERTITSDGAIRYESTDGPICDHFAFPALTHDKAYMVEFQSRNIKGFPLQICISNPFDRRCTLFVHLNQSHDTTTERFLLPPLYDGSQGYAVDINNFTIAGDTSINEFGEIRVSQVDYDTLDTNNVSTASAETTTPISNFRHPMSWLYIVPATATQRIITIDQAYESGWKAYALNNQISKYANKQIGKWLFEALPFIFGTEIKEHVLVNNWENGWILPKEGISKSANGKSTNENETIVLFFWPQLLEYAGFGCILLLPIFVRKYIH